MTLPTTPELTRLIDAVRRWREQGAPDTPAEHDLADALERYDDAEDDDVDCPECDGPTVEADAVDGVYRQCQVCRYAWRVW